LCSFLRQGSGFLRIVNVSEVADAPKSKIGNGPMLSDLSRQLPASLNLLYKNRNEALARGAEITDLIAGNVNQHGVFFPPEKLHPILLAAADQTKVYRPDSLGQLVAREAIAQYYEGATLSLPAKQILLTPGTSLSYWYCFKLLAEAGDEILCPSPSYPLFETIAKLSSVTLTFYRLVESSLWQIDLDYLESQITTRTRGIVLISPHNPTGMVASHDQVEGLTQIASRHHLPIIADEVFSEFLFGIDELPRPALASAPLVFTLNGFSKMFALPEWKLGWIAVSGDPEWVGKSIATLELISDAFLPVNEMVQFSVPGIFQEGKDFQSKYKSWVQRCREIAVSTLSSCAGLQLVPPAGGFYLTVRVPGAGTAEESLAIELLQRSKVLVHPGYFYDIPPSHLVMTFIQEPEILRAALERICEQIGNCRMR
jgi:alanine-synthesizing transaminase